MLNLLPKYNNQKQTKRRTSAKYNSDNSRYNDLIFGFHSIRAALNAPASRVTEIWLSDKRKDNRILALIDSAKQHGVQINIVSREDLDNILGSTRHQGSVARCKPFNNPDESDLFNLLYELNEPPFLLILDCVQDPHNLGACIRTAEAAGVHAVIAPKDGTSSITPTILRVSSGAAERLPFVQVTNLARVLRKLQYDGVWLIGTLGRCSHSIFDVNLKGSLAVILGAEGNGIRRLTREHCDQMVHILMSGHSESLNVSVAAGVCLFEANRQRNL